MSDNMTRVQAICACRNIARLCDENDNVPEDMACGIRDKASSMEKRLTENAKYPNITERMDTALRNMWGGLRKWDRDDKFLDDLFEDLDEVAVEVEDLDASADNKPAPKGRETDDAAAQARSQRFQTKEPNPPGNGPRAQGETRAAPETPAVVIHSAGAIALSEALRRKEAAVGYVLEQMNEAPITVIEKRDLRRMAIADILNMTKSDRTTQMLWAAYWIGVHRGVNLLNSKIQNGGE